MRTSTKRVLANLATWTALFFAVAVSYDDGESYCVIFPQNGRDIFGAEQRNILIFGENEISLIPQVHFEGNARDFGILVPVPTEPTLSTVGANVFTEASFMTQPIVRRGGDGCGCDGTTRVDVLNNPDEIALDDANTSESVTIISEQTVGTFQAVVLQASSGADLTAWLDANDYRNNPDDADILEQYVMDNWFFVAMKLDTAQVPQRINQWWNATTMPARITFASSQSSAIYPLKISAISTDDRVEVLVYTIGPDAMRFPGATMEYANEISVEEAREIAQRYPDLANFIPPGVFVTKLRRTFTKDQMRNDISVSPTNDRQEYREIRYAGHSSFSPIGLVLLALVIFINRRKREV